MGGVSLGLGLGLSRRGNGGSPAGPAAVVAFAYEPEAVAYFAAADAISPLSARRKITLNRMYKRLKAAGIYSKITNAWLMAPATAGQELINLITPGTRDLTKVGTPTVNVNDNVTPAAGAYYSTGILASTLAQNDHHFALFHRNSATNNASSMGATSATNSGISLSAFTTASDVTARSASTVQTKSSALPVSDSGRNLTVVSRRSATGFSVYNASQTVADFTAASAALPALAIVVGGLNNNGTSTGVTRPLSFASIGLGLTQAEAEMFNAIMVATIDRIRFGEPLEERPGIGTANITADVVVYGATPAGLAAAYELKRQGRSVAICGGWRERQVGGMMAGGLGATDIDTIAAIGGLPKWYIGAIQALNGAAPNLNFSPRIAGLIFNQTLDPARTAGADIPVYWNTGVDVVTTASNRITSFTTRDGRTVTATMFIDASYEGDLMARAGVTYVVGREAAGSGTEVLGGFRGISTAGVASNHQYKNSVGLLTVDPFVTPGDSASGLIAGVHRILNGSEPAVGTGDLATYKNRSLVSGSATPITQAFNFRMSMLVSTVNDAALPSAAPTGYSAANYEPLLRWLAAATAQGTNLVIGADMVLPNNLVTAAYRSGTVNDINARNGFSIDLWKGSWTYPESSYEDRETIWKLHESHIRGWFYTLQYLSDARVPAGVRTGALQYSLIQTHYLDPHENDSLYWPPQLYVREARRMVGQLVWDGNDLTMTDGTTPRSIKTVGVAAYAMDSHHTEGLADHSTGTWRIWDSGGFEDQATGGVDLMAPLPYEIITPLKAECENLLVPFCISATHVAFGAIRMELTSMALGQAAGMAAAIAIENTNQAVQDVSYTTLRARLLASPSLSGEVAPVLTQVN